MKPRALPCTPRAAAPLEKFGGEASRQDVEEGDFVDVCVDGHGYHWVLIVRIERGVAPAPAPALEPVPLRRIDRVAARIARRNAEKALVKAREKDRAKGVSEHDERVYYGILSNDPAPACLGCEIGREMTFRHESIKEVTLGAGAKGMKQALARLRAKVVAFEGRERPSGDIEALKVSLGIV